MKKPRVSQFDLDRAAHLLRTIDKPTTISINPTTGAWTLSTAPATDPILTEDQLLEREIQQRIASHVQN